VSSKERRRRSWTPPPSSAHTEGEFIVERRNKSDEAKVPPWIEHREWLKEITPALQQIESELARSEKFMRQGGGSDALAEFNKTAKKLVTARRAVNELPKNTNKNYPALIDLTVKFRRDRATFLESEPITGRLWIRATVLFDAAYLQEVTGDKVSDDNAFVEAFYEQWRDLPVFLNEETGEYSYYRPEGVNVFYDRRHVTMGKVETKIAGETESDT
jgi:hypothetical protein